MKIYVAGPMRGYPERNFPAFCEAAGKIRAVGHVVYNPAEHDTGELRTNLSSDLTWIGLVADGVAVLPGWEASLGANAEVALARAIGIPVWELDNFLASGEAPQLVRAVGCGCPVRDGMTWHQRGTCTDSVANRLGWYGDSAR